MATRTSRGTATTAHAAMSGIDRHESETPASVRTPDAAIAASVPAAVRPLAVRSMARTNPPVPAMPPVSSLRLGQDRPCGGRGARGGSHPATVERVAQIPLDRVAVNALAVTLVERWSASRAAQASRF